MKHHIHDAAARGFEAAVEHYGRGRPTYPDDALGYVVEWDSVARLDDEMLVNGICQIAPLDVGSKQALLEARDLAERADLLVQFMQFQRMAPGGADGPETLQ